MICEKLFKKTTKLQADFNHSGLTSAQRSREARGRHLSAPHLPQRRPTEHLRKSPRDCSCTACVHPVPQTVTKNFKKKL